MRKEFLAVFWRDMKRFVRFRAQIFSSLIQPIIWIAFFGLAMGANFDSIGSYIPVPPGATSVNYLTFMASGVIAMTMLFTSLFGGLVLLFDKNWGLMREMMASPMPRSHILVGISLSGFLKALIQVVLIMLFGTLIGVSFFPNFEGLKILLSIGGLVLFTAIFSLGFLFLSAMISLRLQSMQGVQGVLTLLTMPLFFASNALYSTSTFPEWLKVISLINPLTYLINGLHYFLIGDDFYSMGVHYTYSSTDILISLLFLIGFMCITYLAASRTIKKAIVV
ncbi:MAG: ABC transporter permease [Candidatus Helarchaeota archaeon]